MARSPEGSVYPRKDGRYVATLRVDGRTRSFYGATRRDAIDKRAQARHQLEDGRALGNPRTTLGTYLDHWLSAVAPRTTRNTTVQAYRDQLARARPIAGVKLTALQPHHLERLYAQLLADGLAPATVRSTHVALSRALSHAERTDLIPRNPTTLTTPPRATRRPTTTLSAGQAATLLTTTQGSREHALWTVMLTTGIRAGEACGLKWTDLRGPTLTIRRAAATLPGQGVFLADPKTPSSRRTITLSAAARGALAAHRPLQLAQQVAAKHWTDQDLIFPRSDGSPHYPGNLARLLRRDLDAAGLPRIRVHDLRHTAATLLLEAGINPRVVAELLGHGSVAITLDVYSHVTPTSHQAAADAMDRIVTVNSAVS